MSGGRETTKAEYGSWVERVREALGEDDEATYAFEGILAENRRLIDHHEKYRHYSETNWFQRVAQVDLRTRPPI